ncbi:hypothetical protein G6F50_015640 [Rhizopus delemar]|uniref:Uncharacterized protein n=1 Tax=Rhizopus delemar TaxID=936053 RepID=A0A9P6XWN1_9FUNG|nr:hypothetical protein G6F50_015640 [Rhizopus delemar]
MASSNAVTMVHRIAEPWRTLDERHPPRGPDHRQRAPDRCGHRPPVPRLWLVGGAARQHLQRRTAAGRVRFRQRTPGQRTGPAGRPARRRRPARPGGTGRHPLRPPGRAGQQRLQLLPHAARPGHCRCDGRAPRPTCAARRAASST